GERAHAAFRGGVGGGIRQRDEGLDRADVDDGTLGLAQMRKKRGRHVVGAVEIDRERRVPIGARVRIAYLAAADDAGVVDQYRYVADLARDHAGEVVASGAVGDVAGVVRRVAADR